MKLTVFLLIRVTVLNLVHSKGNETGLESKEPTRNFRENFDTHLKTFSQALREDPFSSKRRSNATTTAIDFNGYKLLPEQSIEERKPQTSPVLPAQVSPAAHSNKPVNPNQAKLPKNVMKSPLNLPLKVVNASESYKPLRNMTNSKNVPKAPSKPREKFYFSKNHFSELLPNKTRDTFKNPVNGTKPPDIPKPVESPKITAPVSDAIKVAQHNDEVKLLSKYLLLEKKLVKVRFCTSVLSPCRCANSTCCGVLAGSVMTDCSYQIQQIGYDGSVPIQFNPCSHVHCISGSCTVVSLLSESGVVLRNRAECCDATNFSQVNCGLGVNCQQRNKNGTYTACCSPGCSHFSQ